MHLRGIGYAFAASLMFGLGAVLAKLLSGEIDATIVAFVDLAVGGLLLAGIVVYMGQPLFKVLPTLTRREWGDLILLSLPGTALPLILIVAGFARTSALQGGFLLQLNGVAALIFAALLLKERIRLKQSIGMVLLLLGSLLVIFKGGSGVGYPVWGTDECGIGRFDDPGWCGGHGFWPYPGQTPRATRRYLAVDRFTSPAGGSHPLASCGVPTHRRGSRTALATFSHHVVVGAPHVYSHQLLSRLPQPARGIASAQGVGNGGDHAKRCDSFPRRLPCSCCTIR